MFDLDLAQQLSPALDPASQGNGPASPLPLSAAEWLGPLAPIALSPFFGLAVLSGTATYGPDWLQERSALFHPGSSLDNPWLFWTMATLALFTSLPRLTKVSKPIGLAADKLEAYSAIIILIGVRLLGSQGSAEPISPDDPSTPLMLSAGAGTISINLVMAGFAALNVFVINCVKLFFEFLVWLIPIPTIDAVVELGNKTICSGLMAIYCYSPWLAAALNLIILSISMVVFLWVYRRLNYYQHMIVGPVLAWLFPMWFAQRDLAFPAFIKNSNCGLPRYLPVTVERLEGEYRISGRHRFKRLELVLQPAEASSANQGGWISQRIDLKDSAGHAYTVSYRRWVKGDIHWDSSDHESPVFTSTGI